METAALREADLAHVWHPFTPMLEYGREETPIIVGGDGFFLADVEGHRYIDGSSSLWCNIHGHRVPAIDEAIRTQLGRIAHSTLLGLASPPSIELARELCLRVPAGLNHVFYSDDGSTAVEAALKIVYQYHRQRLDRPAPRNVFVSLHAAYHGDTVGAVSVGGIDQFHRRYGGLLFPTIKVPAPIANHAPSGHDAASYPAHCMRELEQTLRRHADQIAGFVIEPLVQAAAGILVHPPGYLSRVRQLTTELGIPLIADEVAVGFGRTGTLFACEQEQVRPDVLCLSKGLTGGYLPLAATLVTSEIYAAFLGEPAEGKTFFHGHTYTGNPLGCAAALASLRLFNDNKVLDNARIVGGLLASRLASLAKHPHVGEVRWKGVMAAIDLVGNREPHEPFAADLRIGHRVALAARDRGVIIRPLGDTIVLMPAPAMPPDLAGRLCDAVFEAIDSVLAE